MKSLVIRCGIPACDWATESRIWVICATKNFENIASRGVAFRSGYHLVHEFGIATLDADANQDIVTGTNRSKGNEHSDRQSSVQYFCVLVGRQDICLPKACGSETADSPTADSSVACPSAPRTNVSNARSHLRWNPSSICISGSFRRPARCLACSDCNSRIDEKRSKRSTLGVGLQRRRNPGPVQCYSSGHNLPGATLHGPGLLDSRFLGSCVVGDALHHVRVPLEELESA